MLSHGDGWRDKTKAIKRSWELSPERPHPCFDVVDTRHAHVHVGAHTNRHKIEGNLHIVQVQLQKSRFFLHSYYTNSLCHNMRMQPVSPSTHWCTNPFKVFHRTQAIQRTNIHKTTPKKCVTHVYSPALLSHTLNLLTLSSLRCKHAAAPRQNAPPPRWRTPFLWQWEQASQQYTAQGWGQIPHWDLHTLTNTPRSHIPRGVTPRSAIHNTQGTDLSGTGARYKRETAVILRQTNWNNKWAELHKFDACMLMQVTSWISNMFNQWMRHQRHIIFFWREFVNGLKRRFDVSGCIAL